jgi:hypothetical protein
MQHLKHIEARDRAFWPVMIIPFLALVPLTCFAQTKKSEAKAQVQPAPTSAPFEGCYELKLSCPAVIADPQTVSALLESLAASSSSLGWDAPRNGKRFPEWFSVPLSPPARFALSFPR